MSLCGMGPDMNREDASLRERGKGPCVNISHSDYGQSKRSADSFRCCFSGGELSRADNKARLVARRHHPQSA